MAAKLFKHLGLGGKKVSDQPSQGDFATAKTTTGSVHELRSTSPSKPSAAFVASNSWLGGSSSAGMGFPPAADIGGLAGAADPGVGSGSAAADCRRHSDASTIRGFRSRLPSHLKPELSFRRGLSRGSTVTAARRQPPCGDGGGGGGGTRRSPCADRTDCPSTEKGSNKPSSDNSQPQIASDYSDPFDLKQLGRSDAKSPVKTWSSEDDYCVPYEGLTDNLTASKLSELDAKNLPSMKCEFTSTAEDTSHTESSSSLPPATASTSDAVIIVAENSETTVPENGHDGNTVTEPDETKTLELEQKSDKNPDCSFDDSGPNGSVSDDSSHLRSVGFDLVLTDPSAGMYDAPWDLCATQKNLEEKLFRSSRTPPCGGSDCGAPDFGLKETNDLKNSAEQVESVVTMQVFDEQRNRKSENLHQSFTMSAGRKFEVCSCLPDPNKKCCSLVSDPNSTFWRERSFHGKSSKGIGEQQKFRSGVRTGISSCSSFLSSFCSHHSDRSLKSRHGSDYRHSTFQRRNDAADENLTLEGQSWYHGPISRVAAESLLRVHREGSYLVRMSESDRRDYSLSVKSSSGDFMHMKIVRRDSGFILGQFSQPFASIPQMILYYTINKLPIRGTEHMTLSFPVCSEFLL